MVSLTACNFLKISSGACLVAVSFSIYIKKKKQIEAGLHSETFNMLQEPKQSSTT